MFKRYKKLKIWKKFLIAISILIIGYYILNNGFIMNVNAKTYEESYLTYINTETGIAENGVLMNNGAFYSNFIDYTEVEQSPYTYGYQKFGFSINNNNEVLNYLDSSTKNQIGITTKISGAQNGGINQNYLTGIKITGGSGNYLGMGPFKTNTVYTILLQIKKDDNLYYYQQLLGEDLIIDFNMWYKIYGNTYRNYNNQSAYEIIEKNFYYDSTDNDNPYAYLKVSFQIDPSFFEGPSGDLYLDNIYFRTLWDGETTVLPTQGTEITDEPNCFIKLKQPLTSGYFMVEKIYVVENMDIFIGDLEQYYSVNGKPLNDTIYEECSALDIECHLRNLTTGIRSITDNLIYSIKQMFIYIFIPDFDNIQSHITTLESTLKYKFPDLISIFDYADYFNTRLQNVSRQTTISFPGVKLPGYNDYVIAPFTYDFQTLLDNNTIYIYYSIGRTVIITIICIGWVLLCNRILQGILHDTSSMK